MMTLPNPIQSIQLFGFLSVLTMDATELHDIDNTTSYKYHDDTHILIRIDVDTAETMILQIFLIIEQLKPKRYLIVHHPPDAKTKRPHFHVAVIQNRFTSVNSLTKWLTKKHKIVGDAKACSDWDKDPEALSYFFHEPAYKLEGTDYSDEIIEYLKSKSYNGKKGNETNAKFGKIVQHTITRLGKMDIPEETVVDLNPRDRNHILITLPSELFFHREILRTCLIHKLEVPYKSRMKSYALHLMAHYKNPEITQDHFLELMIPNLDNY